MSFCSCFWENSPQAQLLTQHEHQGGSPPPGCHTGEGMRHWGGDGTPDMSSPASSHCASLGVSGGCSPLQPELHRLSSALLAGPSHHRASAPRAWPRAQQGSVSCMSNPAPLQLLHIPVLTQKCLLTINFQSLWSFFVGYVRIITRKC